jgi:hypothetical protein
MTAVRGEEELMLTRRDLLKHAFQATGAAILGLPARALLAMGDASRLRLALLRYDGNWNARPNALLRVQEELDLRTSVLVSFDSVTVSADQGNIFRYPMLWMTGDRAMEPFSETAIGNLRRHLGSGGTLFVDDASGSANSPFRQSLERELKRIFPNEQLKALPMDHAVFRSYYYIAKTAGRQQVSEHLEGITLDGRAAVIFCANDLSGALEDLGPRRWSAEVERRQPETLTLATRLAVNLVIYALTVDYKLDQVHVSYRLSHPELYPRLETAPGDSQK